jgi:N-acetylglucosaminyl-diphospho-decaprenol L-rhamnosyltransferase
LNTSPTGREASEDRSEDRSQALLDIVIVTSTGARELLRDCLSSLRRHPLKAGPQAVYVTDNASSDGTLMMVREEFPEVTIVTMPEEVAFAAANNYWLQRTSAPFALVLNPDTEIAEGALDYMVEVMRDRPEVGMAGCRLVQRDGTFDHAAKRSFPTPLGALAHFSGIGRRAGVGPRLAQYRAPEVDEHGAGEVDAVNGAFMFVRREAMDEIGLMDEGYGNPGMDDLDWCYRFKQGGWGVWYDGAATVVHVKGGVTVETRKARRYRSLRHNIAFHRSIGRFYRKFYLGRNYPMGVAVYVGIAAKFLIAVTRSTIARRGFR